MNQIKISGNKLTISIQPVKKWVRTVILSLFISLCLLVLLILYNMVHTGMHFIYFIGIVILGLMGWHFIRMLHWNKNGKEIFTVEGNKIKYIADYGKFKDGAQEIGINSQIVIQFKDHHQKPYKYLSINNGESLKRDYKEIRSVIKLSFSSPEKIIESENEVKIWLKKYYQQE